MIAMELVLWSKGRLITWGNSLQDDEQGFGRAMEDKDGLNKGCFHSTGEKMKMIVKAKMTFKYT